MLLPEKLVMFIGGNDGCCGIKVYCDKNEREKVAELFSNSFNEEYETLMDLIEEEEGDCMEKDEELNPMWAPQLAEYGVLFRFDTLAMYSGGGDFISWHNAGEAIDKALSVIKENYPGISYEGYVGYFWSDVHSGEVCQYEIYPERKKKTTGVIYEFVGEALGQVMKDEEFWEQLSEELEDADEDEFKHILHTFHAYSEWIEEFAYRKLLDIAEESDESIKEELETIIDAWNSGEDVEFKESEPDLSGLPDGYMEALEMFMMAEEISGEKPRPGEVISSAGTFDIVIAEAEAGDPDAKFTAGKYFLADHVDGEKERAIRWIKEAADAGVEEAIHYIEEYDI